MAVQSSESTPPGTPSRRGEHRASCGRPCGGQRNPAAPARSSHGAVRSPLTLQPPVSPEAPSGMPFGAAAPPPSTRRCPAHREHYRGALDLGAAPTTSPRLMASEPAWRNLGMTADALCSSSCALRFIVASFPLGSSLAFFLLSFAMATLAATTLDSQTQRAARDSDAQCCAAAT